jgi:hypothetical protein
LNISRFSGLMSAHEMGNNSFFNWYMFKISSSKCFLIKRRKWDKVS